MKRRLPLLLLILILLLAAFLRLYNISQYMTFLGDEGRDVLIVKGILHGDLTLLGPRSSAGDFFMGPAYYYMMTPFLWLFNYDPVGPAVMVALLSVATSFLIYIVGKDFFSKQAGLYAAALYAVSPLVIVYSRSSWNPNVLPFFALLSIYMAFKGIASAHRSWRYFLLTGFLLGICLQLHYLSFFLIGAVVLYVFFAYWYLRGKVQILSPIKAYLQLFTGFIVGFLPFLLFEARHNFANIQAIATFILGGTGDAYEGNGSFIGHILDIFWRLIGRLVFHYPLPDIAQSLPPAVAYTWIAVAVITGIAAVVSLFFIKNKFVVLLFSLWLFVSIILFGFTKKSISDYHMALLFPLPFLLIGNMLSQIADIGMKKKRLIISMLVSFALFLGLFVFSLSDAAFLYPPHKQSQQSRQIAEFILEKTEKKPFNFALLAVGNSDYAYRYFFAYHNVYPTVIQNDVIDPQRKTVTDQLFVLCEGVCEPLGNPTWEIAGYGRATIANEWPVAVGKVYKLVPLK